MISGRYKTWNSAWDNRNRSTKVEKTHRSRLAHQEEKEYMVIDVEYDEVESETEEEDISCEITIPVVNERVYAYNRKGKLEKIKIKNNILKII